MSVFEETIEISKVTSSDLEALRLISIQTFTETFSEHNSPSNMQQYFSENLTAEKLSLEFQNPYSTFYFVRMNDKIIGYLKINSGKAQTEKQSEPTLEIERIYVLKEFHGKHIGQLLFEKAKSIATNNHYNFIWLGVWEKNERAIAFYTKQGFTKFDQHIFVLGNDEQTDIMMKLKLK